MLLNRSKVYSAKLKISELKRKYSSDSILKQNEISSHQSKESNSFDDVSILEGVKHIESSTDSNSKSLNDYINADSNNTLIEKNIGTTYLEGKENAQVLKSVSHQIINSKHESSFVESRVSPLNDDERSGEFSEVVNQLDNLCFISSSSDDEIKTIADFPSYNHQKNNKSLFSDISDEIQIVLTHDEDTAKLEFDPMENQTLLNQSGDSSGICLPLASSLKSKLENSILEYSYSNTFTDTGKTSLENDELSNLASSNSSKIRKESAKDIQQISDIFPVEKIENKFEIDEKNLKQFSSEKLKKWKSKFVESTNGNFFNVANISQKQKIIKHSNSKLKYGDSASKFKIQSKMIDERKLKETRKHRGEKISQLQHSTIKPKLDMGFNRSVKRPVLKSCKLVQNNQPIPIMHYSPDKRAHVTTKRSENVKHHPDPSSSTGHHQCEQVINNLLLNQIQLSRHFIDSHHKMYLLCCQVSKKLSKDYVEGHSLPNKDITQ